MWEDVMVNDDRLTQIRTPEVVTALRGLAEAARDLARRMETNPGESLGGFYRAFEGYWEEVSYTLRRYQIDAQRMAEQ
jgi:hypothetical protein